MFWTVSPLCLPKDQIALVNLRYFLKIEEIDRDPQIFEKYRQDRADLFKDRINLSITKNDRFDQKSDNQFPKPVCTRYCILYSTFCRFLKILFNRPVCRPSLDMNNSRRYRPGSDSWSSPQDGPLNKRVIIIKIVIYLYMYCGCSPGSKYEYKSQARGK